MKKNKKVISIVALLALLIGGYQVTTANFNQNGEVNTKMSASQLGIEIVDFDTTLDKNSDGQYTFSSAMPGAIIARKVGVKNSKDKDLYVRVTITRFWKDKNNNKVIDANPAYIDIITDDTNQWLMKEDVGSNQERIILYCKQPISQNTETSAFMSAIQLSEEIEDKAYSGYHANIQVEVEAVQKTGGAEVMLANWGVEASLDEKGNIVTITE